MTRNQFTLAMRAFGARMFAGAISICHCEADASDAVQDAMCRLWRHQQWYDSADNREAYAVQTAVNCARTLMTRRHVAAELRESDSIDDKSQRDVEWRDRLSHVMRIISSLPERQRLVIGMRDIEGLEMEEIAERLGITVGNVKVLLSRARKSVRQYFSQNL
ncbi:MAG: sigma-70 family RNA polymerase sigma factor [Bacteroides sp.]|nr:sigma-70 family RNA polymerase sigma factor [Bacteroides sp.]